MQDRYAGDIGDFGKLALLRALKVLTRSNAAPAVKSLLDSQHNRDEDVS